MSERVTLAVLIVCAICIGTVTGSCVDPPILKNGYPLMQVNQTSFPTDSRVQYRCHPGHTMPEKSIPFVNCRADSSWSSMKFTCRVKSCVLPGQILNGYFSPFEFTFGKRINYFCNQGFTLNGPTHQFCQVDGWSGKQPVCDQITCPDPPTIDHGFVTDRVQQWEVGNVATYDCDNSYSHIGEQSIFCNESGEWNAEPPQCKVVECSQPVFIPNGQIVTKYRATYTYQDTVTYRCNEDFEMVGESTTECRENSTFQEAPVCKPIPGCPAPKMIPRHAYRMTLKHRYKYGEKIRFTCYSGYRIVGHNPIECKEHGSFQESPFCRLEQCDHPPILPTAAPMYVSSRMKYFIGSRVTYYCLDGYNLENDRQTFITCQYNLMWSEPLFSCVAIECGPPEDIPNGSYTAPGHSFGLTATYSCNVGFFIIGRTVRRCTARGWSGRLPACQHVRCLDPGLVLNGKIKAGFRDLYLYQDSIEYECDAGYQLLGDSVITCTSRRIWDLPTPTCHPTVACPDLPPIQNGQTPQPPQEFLNYLNAVVFICNPTYTLIGENVIHCQANGTWSGKPPQCKVVECLLPDIPIQNGMVMAGFGLSHKYRDIIKYECNEGFRMVGEDTVECREDSTFAPGPLCVPGGDCLQPPRLNNGFPDIVSPRPSFPEGTTIRYRCNAGYLLAEGKSPTITCQADTFWTVLVTVCGARSCGAPPDIEHASYQTTSIVFGGRVTYRCDEGYAMLGQPIRNCIAEGWDGRSPYCDPVACPDLPPIQNGRTPHPSQDFWVYPSAAVFTCNPTYTLIGENTIHCQANGVWSGNPPQCKVVQCGHPYSSIRNGMIKGNIQFSYKYREIIVYKCHEGFRMVGEDTVECREDSTFAPGPVCVPELPANEEPSETTEILGLIRQSITEEQNMIAEEAKLLQVEIKALDVLEEALEIVQTAC